MTIHNFDQASDFSGKQLYSYFSGTELPGYVKTAELDDMATLGGLPKTAFADPSRRIYPLNSPARVFVSNAYFMDKKADIKKLYGEAYATQLETRIKEAACIFEIDADIAAYNASSNVKTAADYSTQYLCQVQVGDDITELYPVKTAADLVKSADHFVRNINNFTFDTRIEASKNIVKIARELDVDEIPTLVMKYAGMFYPDLEALDGEIWRRSTKLKKEANVQLYDKLRQDTSNITSMGELMKLAEVLYHVENMEGCYDNTKTAAILGDPVDKIFTVCIEKTAEDLSVVEVHGEMFKLSDLQKVSGEKYEEAFGFVPEPEKIADVLPTMPRSDMNLFKELTGVRPV